MARKNKQRHLYTKGEFLFNIFSLLIVIGIGIYFGYRSLYYYSKQSIAHEGNNQTLSEVIINSNKLVSEGDGFHQDKEGHFFKGKVNNNYVSFANRTFRIIRINNDGSIKLITDDLVGTFMWGEENSYKKSNLHNWLEKTKEENSGVYYDTIPNIDKFLVKTEYSEDILKDDKVKKSGETSSSYITMLGINDYVLANGKNSFLNNGKIFYILGLTDDQSTLYVEEDGTVMEADHLSGYGVRAVITLKKDIISAYGDGTIDNPYTIEQGKDTNYINSIVKLGDDTWKVYKEKDDLLSLVKTDYIKLDTQEFKYHFSKKSNYFDLQDWNGLAAYLNNSYLNSLSYKDLIESNDYYIGEIGVEEGYSYNNIYKEKVNCRVGLLNIFDYYNENANDFYLMNTYQGELQYTKYSN